MPTPLTTVTGQEIDLDDYDELCDFRGWLANAVPNLRSGTFRLQFDTEGTNPVPHADLINSYGEMLIVRVYKMRHVPVIAPTDANPHAQAVDETVDKVVAGAPEPPR